MVGIDEVGAGKGRAVANNWIEVLGDIIVAGPDQVVCAISKGGLVRDL